jgi:hypothetical protein
MYCAKRIEQAGMRNRKTACTQTKSIYVHNHKTLNMLTLITA